MKSDWLLTAPLLYNVRQFSHQSVSASITRSPIRNEKYGVHTDNEFSFHQTGRLSTWIAHVLQTTLRNINFFIVEWEKSYDEFFQTNFDNFVQSKICRWPQKRKKKFVNYWGQRLLNFRLAEKVDFSKELQKYWQKPTVSQPTLKTHFETFHTRSNPLFIGLPVANNMFPLESDLFFYFDLFLGMEVAIHITVLQPNTRLV